MIYIHFLAFFLLRARSTLIAPHGLYIEVPIFQYSSFVLLARDRNARGDIFFGHREISRSVANFAIPSVLETIFVVDYMSPVMLIYIDE